MSWNDDPNYTPQAPVWLTVLGTVILFSAPVVVALVFR